MTKGFDLVSILEKHLKTSNDLDVLEFPYKKMKGSGYHGVYDKKYCNKLIAKVDADILILNRMKGDLSPYENRKGSWGYATKIVTTKGLKQVKSIHAENLEDFSDIDPHVSDNIEEMIKKINEMI